jgi:tetratricopeptide (TPR) repeat protein
MPSFISMARIVRYLSLLVVALGCAVPRDQASFEVRAPGDISGAPFFSSQELRATGLVSESITMGSKGRLFEAESRLRKAQILNPGNAATDFNLAMVLGQQGSYEEARAILQRQREQQGDRPHLMVALADLARAEGDLEKAKGYLKNAFATYAKAQNVMQASLIARSIANLAFAGGHEQEALCYSYEALGLYPSAADLGQHASVMVGLNLFEPADNLVADELKKNAALGSAPLVHHALALARGSLGKLPEALEEVEVAQSLLVLDPELGPEVNSLWWLLQREVPPKDDITEKDAEALNGSLEAFYPDVIRLQERSTYALVRWPPYYRALLANTPAGLYD